MNDDRYFSLNLAKHIGNISRRQAIDWARDGAFIPTKLYAYDERPYVFFYSFGDLVALRIIWLLRQQYGLSFRSALPAADYIRANINTPWSDLRFWVVKKQIHFSEPDVNSAVLIELAPIAEDVRKEADKLWYRNADDFGKIERRRNVMGGALVVKGTRIPISTIINMTSDGASVEEILRAYPTLVREDIRNVLQRKADHRQVA